MGRFQQEENLRFQGLRKTSGHWAAIFFDVGRGGAVQGEYVVD